MLPSLPILSHKNRLRVLWSGSLLLNWSLHFFLGSAPWPWAYGSFLVWALTAGYVWGRKAPFLAVGIFCVVSASLSWEVLSTGVGLVLVFLSSLVSTLHFNLLREQSRNRELQGGLLQIARFHVWGRMTVGLGHELRNQIAIVTGYLDQMKEDELPAAHRRKIERSLLANDRMLKLLTQLSLLTRDAMHEPLHPLCLPEVLQNALTFVERPLEYHSIQVRSTALPDLPRAFGHPTLMQTLFMTFILHSVDRFKAQDGSGKTIDMDLVQDGERLRFHYRDNAQSDRRWTYADRILVEQMLQRLGASLHESAESTQGWELTVLFRMPDSPPDSNATAAEECS